MSGGHICRSVAVAGLLAILVCGGCAGRMGGRPIEGPVLAVLSYSPDELVLVEPETLSVIKRVGLRSMGTDPLASTGSRVFVTAQCGGVGDDADDALAVIDLRTGGTVRYIALPEPNPGFVEPAGGDTVLVSHGIWSAGGIPVTRVDLATGAVAAHGLVANAYGGLLVAAGSLWTVGPEGADVVSPDHTVRRTALDLSSSDMVAPGEDEALIAPDGDSNDSLLLVTPEGRSARLSRVSAVDFGVITTGTVEGLDDGIAEIISVGDLLVLRDSIGQNPADPGGPLIVLDRATLKELRRIDVGGSVSSVAALGDRVFAIRWDSGELVKVDPATGAILNRARLDGLTGKMAQMAAMDAVNEPDGP